MWHNGLCYIIQMRRWAARAMKHALGEPLKGFGIFEGDVTFVLFSQKVLCSARNEYREK